MIQCISCHRHATGRIVSKAGQNHPFCDFCAKRGLYNKALFDFRDGNEPEVDPNTYVVRVGEWPLDDHDIYAGPDIVAATAAVMATEERPAYMDIWLQGEKLITLYWNGEKWENAESQQEAVEG